jgi:hypothetical protein
VLVLGESTVHRADGSECDARFIYSGKRRLRPDDVREHGAARVDKDERTSVGQFLTKLFSQED